MITLLIDTTDIERTTVSLDIDGRIVTKDSASRVLKSQMTLPLIESLL